MERQTITKELGEILSVSTNVVKIDNLISILTEAKRNGANHAYVDCTRDWEGEFDTLEITALEIRWETDEEINERFNKEREKMAKHEAAARAEYERLKKLFGDE